MVTAAIAAKPASAAFDARFDTEVDALLIMVLCVVLVVIYDLAVWVLAIGLLRYLFEAAGLLMPWLRAPLAGNIWGRAIGCYQVLALVLALLPRPTAVRELLLVSALLLLMYSFTSDIRSLHKRAACASTTVSIRARS